jgi:hypothetical protein
MLMPEQSAGALTSGCERSFGAQPRWSLSAASRGWGSCRIRDRWHRGLRIADDAGGPIRGAAHGGERESVARSLPSTFSGAERRAQSLPEPRPAGAGR